LQDSTHTEEIGDANSMAEIQCLRLSDPTTEVRAARQENLKPVCVHLQGQVVSARNWIDVARTIVHWLIDTGRLTETQLPVPYADNPRRFFIGSDPSRFYTRTDRDRAKDLGNGMFLNTQAGAELLMDNCRLLLEKCGVAPETVCVDWKRKL